MESVLTQPCDDFEYIIIDGASTDNSVEVIEEFLAIPEYATKITYWVSEPDKGIYNAMNKGILKATGEYCLFLNSGDWLVDEEVLTNAIRQFDGTEIISGQLLFSNGQLIIPREKYNCITLYDEYIPHPSTFIKHSLLTKGYSEKYSIISDYVFFYEKVIFENVSYKMIPLIVTYFNLEGISSTNKEKSKFELGKFYQNNLPSYLIDLYREDYNPTQRKIKFYGEIVYRNNILILLIKILEKLHILR